MQNFLKINTNKILLLFIILLGAFFRFYNLNWDQGHHLHPDERAIIMFVLPLQFPNDIAEFFSPQSSLNPHFFAYGNFPLYLLKGTAAMLSFLDRSLVSYDKINLLGRFMSGIADLGTIVLIYLIGKKIFDKTAGIIGAFFYSIAVFPIQLAHFYAVDSLLTFFITITLFRLIVFYEKPTIKNSIFIGISFALALVTKISAFPLVVAIITAICVDFFLIFFKKPHRVKEWFPHVPRFLRRLFTDGLLIISITVITFIILQPYAVIDFKEFLRQTQEQSRMTQDAFTFPYTLQYVGKIPYLYELKNIFLWGLGPMLSSLAFLGTLYIIYLSIKQSNKKTIIILTFFIIYFIIVGRFAVGWMRYMLPLYPLLCLFAAILVYKLFLNLKSYFLNHKFLFIILNSSFLILIFVWPFSFMHIYTQPNTRILASEWIYKNIPPNSIIAREHWDDGLPIGGSVSYKILELPIYEMQNPFVENRIYQTAQESDYIIIASNRLYAPLQRIAKNCDRWNVPKERCPINANRYYEKLFNGKLGYKKAAEFSNHPSLEIRNLKFEINDSSADESFTVYDHPKIMIFKNEKKI